MEPVIIMGLAILTVNILMWSLVLYWTREGRR